MLFFFYLLFCLNTRFDRENNSFEENMKVADYYYIQNVQFYKNFKGFPIYR